MTALETTIKAIASVKVGTGTVYAVRRIEQDFAREADDRNGAGRVRFLTWRLLCFAEAADNDSVAALKDAIETQLGNRGEAVTLTRFGGSQVMPAAGTSGSMTGYPRVTISDVAEESFGTMRTFRVECVTKIPAGGGAGGAFGGGAADADLVSHDYARNTTTDDADLTTVRVQGSVRVVPGEVAADWINTNILGPQRTAYEGAGNPFVGSVDDSNDPEVAGYTYTAAPPPEISGGGGVEDPRVRLATRRDRAGRVVVTASGSAKGSNATTFAEAQKPAEDSTSKLTSEELSEPQTPDGKVDFRYEMLSGVADSNIGASVVVFRFVDRPVCVSRGGSVGSALYPGTDPLFFVNPDRGVLWRLSVEVHYVGPALSDAELLAQITRHFAVNRLMEHEYDPTLWDRVIDADGIRVDRFGGTFAYAAADDPGAQTPYQVPGLGA